MASLKLELSAMLADIDEFKNFNTKFGHLTGDRVLAEVAALLQNVTRYGGDEFLVIMPDTDLAQAEVAVHRLGWWLEKWNSSEQREYRLGINCGVVAYKPETTVEDVIKAADADLYVQKARRIEALPY
jgi:diguanylate cyclase (GGDEF)-like protein